MKLTKSLLVAILVIASVNVYPQTGLSRPMLDEKHDTCTVRTALSENSLENGYMKKSGNLHIEKKAYSEYAGIDTLEGDALDKMLDKIVFEIERYKENGQYGKALELYGLLYEKKRLNELGILEYAACQNQNGNHDKSQELLATIDYWGEENDNYSVRRSYFIELQKTCFGLKQYEASMEAGQKALSYCDKYIDDYFEVVCSISNTYAAMGDTCRTKEYIREKTDEYLRFMGLKPTDYWDKGYKDSVANLFYLMMLPIEFNEKNVIIAAAWGNPSAMEICEEEGYNYKEKPDYEY